jgi:tetratricopeptide (TPR) repeat protein
VKSNTYVSKTARFFVSKFRSIDPKKRSIYLALGALVVVIILFTIGGVFKPAPVNQPTPVADNSVVKEYRSKLPELKAATQKKPDDASARGAYAQALYVTGDKQTAKIEYEAAMARDPKNASTANNLGNVYRDLKEYDAAVASYKNAYKLDPSLLNAYVNLATMQAYELHKPADAVQTYKAAVAKNGQSSELLLLLAGAYEQNGQKDLALATYRASLEKDPQNETAKKNIERLTTR